MRKEIKKWGHSFVIRFSPEEMRTNDLKLGTVIDLSDMVIIKRKSSPRALKQATEVSHNG